MKKILFCSILVLIVFCRQESADKTVSQPTPAAATATVSEPLVISEAWVKEANAAMKNTGGFLKIENNSREEISLASAESDISKIVELHETVMEKEVMKMNRLESIRIPAGSSVQLKPGSLHIMFIGLKKDIKEGEDVKIVLNFSGGIKKEVSAKVKKLEGMMDHHHKK
ncbi:MAG TPA: copper chaperone PCu(A)C [Leptospiraceae bacterium]|nr:copper chaperone PCu(A)C [Leptospiraceae bacterium]HNI98212.1 copper chaperone PCu(A)C [Leptospiraceae bacterium]HNM06058.1 copper chaperone PCu(A)C [Leptospiraceae bacterium]HNN07187.1 copper chaperone PCu(A)C [Leptospiraceae bacterium]